MTARFRTRPPVREALMPLATVDSLVDDLRSHPFLRPEQLRELLTKLAPAHRDTQELARTLIRLRWITVYQAKKLLAGKADELALGQYLVVDKLGEGGMGKVFKAIQLNLNRPVALKVVRTSLLKNETTLKRFRREVRSAAHLTHPNIVRVFDADQVGDRHFLAMEYIEGIDLGKLVKDRGPLPVAMACAYVRQAALGLQHAHDRSMVHRDIKPANLLVAVNDQGQYAVGNPVKILDLGLARIRADEVADEVNSTELTRAGMVVGTPDYMSPEQAKNSSTVDHRSDLYALGCTLYYLLTGQPPFPNGNPLEKLLQHQMDAPRPVQSLRREVPGELATTIHCLLAKRPEDRFQSGAALAHALGPWSVPAKGGPPTLVLAAEPADLTAVALDTDPNDPFDFGAEDPTTPPDRRRPTPERLAERRRPRRSWAVPLVTLLLAIVLVATAATGLVIAARKKAADSPPVPVPSAPKKGELARPEPG